MSAWVTAEQLASFMARIERVPGPMPEPCWHWTGSRGTGGYGNLNMAVKATRSTSRAHRFAYAVASGAPIPVGGHVLHTCHIRHCVNPAHLYLSDNAQNTRDREAAGNTARGITHAMAKLTEQNVREIRFRIATEESLSVIARAFGVDRPAIYKIAKGWTWKHVK